MNISRISSLIRSIDTGYFPNLLILVLSAAVLLLISITRFLSGIPVNYSLVDGTAAAIAVFLSWALTREMDPDNDYTAILAAFLVAGYIYLNAVPNLLLILWLLLIFRILSRTSGNEVTMIDSLVVFIVGVWIILDHSWIFGPVMSAFYILDSRLPPAGRRHLYFAIISIIISVVLIGIKNSESMEIFLEVFYILFTITVLYIPAILISKPVKSMDDKGKAFLSSKRIQIVRLIGLKTFVMAALLIGADGLVMLSTLWIAMVSVSVTWLYANIMPYLRILND
ncbi:conserved hypothetical protein [Methanosalsum zhilinae DSM 4017]|uniref:Uncharacterized protein n=1 Tax=Methanosalsum zhilinae (strain DSM 4017 / NBRC 107636 / OCM 62 / WeN5) TaxID=679901 RepID=F7XNR3_METZD|nr:hypothetical protein [Methanosalsum zhilinae]AEH61264.1 conserved hypothetical protein [Methanosalsum zhilinae DSM 4017]